MAHIPKSFWVFLSLTVLLSMVATFWWYRDRFVLHLGEPYKILIPGGGLIDYKTYELIMPYLGQYRFVEPCPCMPLNGPVIRYPAPVVIPYALLYALPHKDVAMQLFMLACFVTPAVFLGRAIVQRGVPVWETSLFVAGCLLTAYPMAVEWRTGNMEVIIFLLVLFAIRAFLKDRFVLAGVLIGIAAGMKIYPMIYLGLLVAQRKYKAVAIAAATAVLLNLVSLMYITPSLAYSWHGVGLGLSTYSKQMFLDAIYDARFDHSPFAVVKRIDFRFFQLRGIRALLDSYIVMVGLAGAILFFTHIRKLPTLNQILLLTLFATFAPPSSFDYTLMTLYIPFALLLLYSIDHAGQRLPGIAPIVMCFVVIFGLESEFIFHGEGLGGGFRAVAAIALFTLALKCPLRLLRGGSSVGNARLDTAVAA